MNLLVFFLNVDNAGVQKEADLIFERYPMIIFRTIFLEEEDKNKKHRGMSSLLRNELNRFNIMAGTFIGKKNAANVAEGLIKNRAKTIYSKRNHWGSFEPLFSKN